MKIATIDAMQGWPLFFYELDELGGFLFQKRNLMIKTMFRLFICKLPRTF